MKLANCLAPFVLALFPQVALAQQDLSKVEIKTEKLSDTVYMMTGSGGNLGVSAGPDGVFLIGHQFAPLPPEIRAATAKATAKPAKFPVKTPSAFAHVRGQRDPGHGRGAVVAPRSRQKT